MGKRYLVVEIIDRGQLSNVEFDDVTSPEEASNSMLALKRAGVKPTGIYSIIEVEDGIERRVGSLTETVRNHFLDFKSRVQWLR